MFYNRQKRAKLFRNLIIREEEIMERIWQLKKRPTELVVCLGSGDQSTDTDVMRVREIVKWTELLEIKSRKIYTLAPQQLPL